MKAANSIRITSFCRLLRCLLVLACAAPAQGGWAQQQPVSSPQPPNAAVSDFGVSFCFSPPICAGCVEAELGFQSQQDARYAPAVLTVAPKWLHGDVSVLGNVVDSEAAGRDRTTNFGNRLDFAIREKVLDHGGLSLTLVPWGTAWVRGVQGGRAGGVALPQYTLGSNQFVAEFSLTGAVGVSAGNPRTDYLEAFDYTRAMGSRGYSVFSGFQHEILGGEHTVGIEQGMIIPFRNGQIELAAQGLSLNADPQVAFQARAIVNWGAVLGRRGKS
jgi:hypothetical protein